MRPVPIKSPLDHRELIAAAFAPLRFRDTGIGTLKSVDGTTGDQQDVMYFLERRGAITGTLAGANIHGSFIEISAVDPAALATAVNIMNSPERQKSFDYVARALSTLTCGLPWTSGKTIVTLDTGVGSKVDQENMGPLVMAQLQNLQESGVLEFHFMDGRFCVTEVSSDAAALLNKMMPKPRISGPAGLPDATTKAMREMTAERAGLARQQTGSTPGMTAQPAG